MNTLILAIEAGGLLRLLVYIIAVGLIFWLAWWILHQFAPPQPILKVLEVIIIVIGVIVLINLLLGLIGHSFISL